MPITKITLFGHCILYEDHIRLKKYGKRNFIMLTKEYYTFLKELISEGRLLQF